MNKKTAITYLSIILTLLIGMVTYYAFSFIRNKSDASLSTETPASLSFESVHAYADVQTQVDFGPRTPGSEGHAKVREWMRSELESAGWVVEVHESRRLGHPIFNLIAKRSDEEPQIILGAHYDTRFFADNDPDPRKTNRASARRK